MKRNLLLVGILFALVACKRIETETPVSTEVEKVSLNKNSLTLEIGQVDALSVSVEPSSAANREVSWNSSNVRVASVSANGEVKALAVGQTVITASSKSNPSKQATCDVTVTEKYVAVNSIKLDKSELPLLVGESKILKATVEPKNATNPAVIWSSSNENVAIVDKEGKVTAITPGETVITAKSEGDDVSSDCKVEVSKSMWEIVSSTFAKNTPLTAIRVKKVQASAASDARIILVTDPDKENYQDSRHYYFINYWALDIYRNGVKMSSFTGGVNAGDDWYEFSFGEPVYLYSFGENAPSDQLKGHVMPQASPSTIIYTTASLKTIQLRGGFGDASIISHTYQNGYGMIKLDRDVETIGDKSFQNASSTSQWLTSILLPETVKRIDDHAFDNCRDLRALDLPEGLTDIGGYAFYGCTGFTSFVFPESLSSIGSYAFHGCSGLTSLDLPDGLMSVGDHAFYSCTGLTSVSLPLNLVEVGRDAFASCSKLSSAQLGRFVEETTFASVFGTYNTNHSPISSLVIADGVTKLSDNCFSRWSQLMSISLPESLTSIGNYAFLGCTGLTSVVLPKNLVSIGNSAFYGCTGFSSFVFPESLSFVGSDAFYGCSRLTAVALPLGLIDIGDTAFMNCDKLTSATIGKFVETNSLIKIFSLDTHLKSLELLEGVEKISDNCIHDVNISSVSLPQSIRSIGDKAFYNCNILSSINLPEGLLEIGENAFYNCRLNNLVIPDSVVRIGKRAFYHCRNLNEVHIPFDLEDIGDYAFYDCDAINIIRIGIFVEENRLVSIIRSTVSSTKVKVIIQEGVSHISDSCFTDLNSLSSISIPNSVTDIGNRAFYSCSGLSQVSLPRGIKSIGAEAFFYCSNLKEIVINAIEPPIGGSKMFDYTNNCTIYFNSPEVMEACRNAQYWKDYSNRFQLVAH